MKNWSVRLFLCLTLLILVISSVYVFYVHKHFLEWETSGAFGDTFGALTSIFSGLALAGLVTTIVMQRRQLDEQQQFNKLEYNERRYQYLIGQVKAWRDSKSFDHVLFFVSVEEYLNKDEDFRKSVYYRFGTDYEHFVYIFKKAIHFIVTEYVPNNCFLIDQKKETNMLIKILKSKLTQKDLLLIAIHAVFMDKELENIINDYGLITNLKEENYSEYTKISGILNRKYVTWETQVVCPS